MKTIPILFSAPMIRALMCGTKTQTRRPLKPQPIPNPIQPESLEFNGRRGFRAHMWEPWAKGHPSPGYKHLSIACPYGQPGDLIWVREAWRTTESIDHCAPRNIVSGACIQYECGGTNLVGDNCDHLFGAGRYRSSIFMPRWASRITLSITDVRVERLWDISEADAVAEGVASVAEYIDLWKLINKSWDANPWVWCLSFSVIKANVESLIDVGKDGE